MPSGSNGNVEWKPRNAIDYSPLYRSGRCWWCALKRWNFKRKHFR